MVASLEVLVFSIAGVRYGLPSQDVDGLARMVAITPLPAAPSIVEGAIDMHGSVVPVLDMRSRFGHAPRPPTLSDRLILARAGNRRVAVRSDSVSGLVYVEPDVGALERLGAASTTLIAGVATLPDGLVLIHDLATFLTEAEAAMLDTALPR